MCQMEIYDNLVNSRIDRKISLYKMSYYVYPDNSSTNKVTIKR